MAGKLKTVPPPGSTKVMDWMGLRVRTTEILRNGYGQIPKGSVGKVDRCGYGIGLSILFDPCPCCKIQFHITRVEARHVEVITQ